MWISEFGKPSSPLQCCAICNLVQELSGSFLCEHHCVPNYAANNHCSAAKNDTMWTMEQWKLFSSLSLPLCCCLEEEKKILTEQKEGIGVIVFRDVKNCFIFPLRQGDATYERPRCALLHSSRANRKNTHRCAGIPAEHQRVCWQGSAMGVRMFQGLCSPHSRRIDSVRPATEPPNLTLSITGSTQESMVHCTHRHAISLPVCRTPPRFLGRFCARLFVPVAPRSRNRRWQNPHRIPGKHRIPGSLACVS